MSALQPIEPAVPFTELEPRHKPLYVGVLAERFLKALDQRREYLRKRYKRDRWITCEGLAKKTGMEYETVFSYIKRRRPMGIAELDKLMWASGFSLLELIEPNEILSYLESMDYLQRNYLHDKFRKVLDRRSEQVSNNVSDQSAASQMPNAADDTE